MYLKKTTLLITTAITISNKLFKPHGLLMIFYDSPS
jgi:hypothetical protein